MSLLISVIRPELVRLAVDTEALWPDGTRDQVSKLVVVPHASLVCVGQGDASLNGCLFKHLVMGRGTMDYDNAISAVPRAIADFVVTLRAHGVTGGYRVHLAGYSPARGRMLGHLWEGSVDSDEVDDDEMGAEGIGFAIAPWQSERPPIPDSPTEFHALAAEQVKLLREAGTAGGGCLMLTEITTAEVRIRNIGPLL